jgi:hypothetical protein
MEKPARRVSPSRVAVALSFGGWRITEHRVSKFESIYQIG